MSTRQQRIWWSTDNAQYCYSTADEPMREASTDEVLTYIEKLERENAELTKERDELRSRNATISESCDELAEMVIARDRRIAELQYMNEQHLRTIGDQAARIADLMLAGQEMRELLYRDPEWDYLQGETQDALVRLGEVLDYSQPSGVKGSTADLFQSDGAGSNPASVDPSTPSTHPPGPVDETEKPST